MLFRFLRFGTLGSQSCFVLLCLAGCVPLPTQESFQAGVAAVEITPDWPVALGGYGARLGRLSDGVHDPVVARALYLETPDCKVAIVATDLIGSLKGLRDDVRKDLPPDVHLILTASHTHSGPGALVDTKEALLVATVGRYDPKLYDWVRKRIVLAVQAAMRAREPAEAGTASLQLPEFSKNRRSENYPEGEAPLDPTLSVLKAGAGWLINYPAHATVLPAGNMKISADWPGAMTRHLLDRGFFALYTNGAEGDVSPRTLGGSDGFDKCERMGEAIAGKIAALPLHPMKVTRLRYVEREIELPPPALRSWTRKSVIGVLSLNDIAFVCVPGELSVELGLEVKRRFRDLGFRDVWILGLANDHLFYILSEEQYRKGGYERNMSFYGAGFGPWLVDRLADLGRSLPHD